jgi:hypothetical protein
MSARLFRLAEALAADGLMSEAALRRLRIHESYWILRDAGLSQADAQAQVAGSFGVSPDTVQVYARGRERFSALVGLAEGEPAPPQS